MMNYSIRPASRQFGFDRGQPVDRYYIEQFLKEQRHVIKGNVLEIGENRYTKEFGTDVASLNILDIDNYPGVTIVANLETGENIPESTYDCFILTQVIHILYDVKTAIRNAVRVLKPGGSLIVTVPGLSQSCRTKEYGDYWRFTSMSFERLLSETSSVENVDMNSYGNLATAQAFLDGRAAHEIPRGYFTYKDPQYELVMAAVVTKSSQLEKGDEVHG
ncbi:methyltransferase domain-containing protein [Alkalihalobacillus sp. AL-G]|uniref:methyltransferase domain-containing protein n=1 Tax=Alkalihalobacillus sp. AL-G TaxID=2926399 RepID=UPI00272A998D|nr:methyltransferase domain-containing protein [Alkalihalobacillus sp. AL-G]WLD94939.1 class I SAM-dependent methyltransferase [Alkalihalobacillus sp. AL-G]